MTEYPWGKIGSWKGCTPADSIPADIAPVTANLLLDLSISPRWQKIRNGDRSCAENVDLSHGGIAHGKCIDHALIKNLFGLTLNGRKDIGQRDDCGCIKSVAIGMYNTCLHSCAYCYAT